MYEASAITSETFQIGLGGDIVVSFQNASLSGEATIASRTAFADPAAAAGGTITLQGLDGPGTKADALTLAGFRTGIISDTFGSGSPGDVGVHAETVSLTGGAVIEAGNPQSTGTGGDVIINAGSVEIIGSAGGPGTESHISSQASGLDAGQVIITADQLTLDNGSIAASTVLNTPGRGGDVVLNVGIVSLTNGATINSSTAGMGRAGDITMNVGTLSLADGSSISSTSTGVVVTNPDDGTTQVPGRAGNVAITASGGFTSDASTVATSAEANHGGDISITAQSVGLSNGTLITANSKAPLEVTKLVLDQDGQLVSQVVGDGNAGNITAHSGSTFVMNNSSMTTEATQASGGQVVITAPEMVQLSYSKISTSVAGSAVDTAGGNITIDPQFVILQNSQILAQAFAGAGGNITIVSNVFMADPFSQEHVSASSQLGISGTINIQSPLQNVGAELTALSQEFSSAAALLAQQCAARAADGKFSTFVVAAREGLPVEPGGFLASPSLTAELLGSRLSGRDPQTQLSAVTGLFPKYDARPIQLAKYGDACHRQ
jgi:large exoprotein involved in heme utilization and adhesion